MESLVKGGSDIFALRKDLSLFELPLLLRPEQSNVTEELVVMLSFKIYTPQYCIGRQKDLQHLLSTYSGETVGQLCA